MTKPMWEKASVPMRQGHSGGNTGPSYLLKVTRSKLLVIFSFYWQRWRHYEAFYLKYSLHHNLNKTCFRYK